MSLHYRTELWSGISGSVSMLAALAERFTNFLPGVINVRFTIKLTDLQPICDRLLFLCSRNLQVREISY